MPKVETKGGDDQYLANVLNQDLRKKNKICFWLHVATVFAFATVAVMLWHIYDKEGARSAEEWANSDLFLWLLAPILVIAIASKVRSRQWPLVLCPRCDETTSGGNTWLCGYCGHMNNTNNLFNNRLFVDPCKSCGKVAPAIACSHCGDHLMVDPKSYPQNLEHVAKFFKCADPVEKVVK